jgi:ferredoxin
MQLPVFLGGECLGCGRCVVICPGLAISLLVTDADPTGRTAQLLMPWEMGDGVLVPGQRVVTVGLEGQKVGRGRILAIRRHPDHDRRRLVLVEVPHRDRLEVAGFRMRTPGKGRKIRGGTNPKTIVCRCERVVRDDVIAEIRRGVRDLNQMKATLRCGMGACGGRTCGDLIMGIFREEGIDLADVEAGTVRPFFEEVPLGVFAGADPSSREGQR